MIKYYSLFINYKSKNELFMQKKNEEICFDLQNFVIILLIEDTKINNKREENGKRKRLNY